ncbi:response regulator [Pontibacter pamirensis]|uniref:response regulator n=1 Tax=Pontibacter pamirensis TaxID=2562824 RepID=UPI00138A5BF9|nr:response regulator [Pontibacter pamirensis]
MKKNILLIDDDATYIYLLKYQLRKHRIVGEIVTACNGSEALEIIKRGLESGELPQVIISDIEMPLMSGITFYKEIARLKLIDYAVTRVVLNSSNSQYKVLDWSVESPHVVYFSKPLTEEHLLTILAN